MLGSKAVPLAIPLKNMPLRVHAHCPWWTDQSLEGILFFIDTDLKDWVSVNS